MTDFTTLKKINVNDHIEKKGNLSYLSWAWAVDQLLSQDPTAVWSYGEPRLFGQTMMVFCTVRAFGKEMTAQLPVMDYKNKAIPNPDAMAVNTAMQRCLAKAIALHGIGLYIYAGEDLPQDEVRDLKGKKVPSPDESAKTIAQDHWEQLDDEEKEFLRGVADKAKESYMQGDLEQANNLIFNNNLKAEEITAMSSLFDSKMRSDIKKFRDQLRKAA